MCRIILFLHDKYHPEDQFWTGVKSILTKLNSGIHCRVRAHHTLGRGASLSHVWAYFTCILFAESLTFWGFYSIQQFCWTYFKSRAWKISANLMESPLRTSMAWLQPPQPDTPFTERDLGWTLHKLLLKEKHFHLKFPVMITVKWCWFVTKLLKTFVEDRTFQRAQRLRHALGRWNDK